jgi:hypothetical protein
VTVEKIKALNTAFATLTIAETQYVDLPFDVSRRSTWCYVNNFVYSRAHIMVYATQLHFRRWRRNGDRYRVCLTL